MAVIIFMYGSRNLFSLGKKTHPRVTLNQPQHFANFDELFHSREFPIQKMSKQKPPKAAVLNIKILGPFTSEKKRYIPPKKFDSYMPLNTTSKKLLLKV